MIKSLIGPVAISVMTGIGASYIATHMSVAVLQTQVQYLEEDMAVLEEILARVTDNQHDLMLLAERASYDSRRINKLESAVFGPGFPTR